MRRLVHFLNTRAKRHPVLLWVLVLSPSVALFLGATFGRNSEPGWRWRHRRAISAWESSVGKAKSAAVKTLGPPDFVVRKEDIGKPGVVYPIPGYATPDRGIDDSVMIYSEGDLIGYLFVDELNKVTDVFYGPS